MHLSYFVTLFICLAIALALVAPIALALWRDNKALRSNMHHVHHDMSQTLRQAEHYKIACETTSDGLLIQDMQGNVLWCNQAFCDLHKRPMETVLGRNPLTYCLPEQDQLTPAQIAQSPFNVDHSKSEVRLNQKSDGELFWNEIRATLHTTTNGQDYAVLVCRDVTEKIDRQTELENLTERLEFEASHDLMTGLANRAAFMGLFNDALTRPCGEEAPVGVLHIDLDNFKEVNDTHGHSVGDATLLFAAGVLRDCVRGNDVAARIGGDEFVVVCPDAPDLTYLQRLGASILSQIGDPVEWSGRTLQISASIGAALSSDTASTPEDLLNQADFALYEVKRKGGNGVACYDDIMHAAHVTLIDKSAELVEAIDTGALDYYYQPQLNMHTGTVSGFETLVRWNHSTEGLIPPDEFLPLAKDLGLMGMLDLHSMTAALEQKARMDRAGATGLTFAFNASPELLAHPEFVNRLIWGVEAGGIERGEIVVEVLETTEFGDAAIMSSHAATIRDLRRAGFKVELDDFGVGFAGLSHLAKLDVTGVKIDRSLIMELLTDETAQKVVRKTVELCHDLGLSIIAEGVESPDIASCLADMGCGNIQGYWLSPPMEADALEGWLALHNATNRARSA